MLDEGSGLGPAVAKPSSMHMPHLRRDWVLLEGSHHEEPMWVVVKMMVPFWIPIIIRHLILRVPKKGP